MERQPLEISDGNTIELHYWFNDNTHAMDALVQNGSEHEFLQIIKEVSKIFEVEIIIETEPMADGGLRKWFKIITLKENKAAVITTAVIMTIITSLFIAPIAQIEGKLIEKVFENKELKSLETEKIKSEIERNNSETEKNKTETENLKVEVEQKKRQINDNQVLIKKRSNFYEILEKYPKLAQVSFVSLDEHKKPTSQESFVKKEEFKKYILVSDDLEPIKIEGALIDIISPVLKKGNYQWRGLYEGEVLAFNMKSIEFKILVQSGKIEFKNGSSIKCLLRVDRKINNDGMVRITSYNIMRVDEYFENNKPIETPEGKSHRRKQLAKEQQMNLFSDKTENLE